jgi:multidrug efflux pump subunit AcrA (membrane-fusion protein)
MIATLCSCGKSSEQREQERLAREAAVQKAIADSQAEERAKDRRMREAASAEANERIVRESSQRDVELTKASAKDAAAARAQAVVDQAKQQEENAMRVFMDRLRYSRGDPELVEIRNPHLAPKRNGMCADVAFKDKNGRFTTGFKRVVVTDARVATEEPPVRDTMTLFLVFQLTARDTGCFPDVQQTRITQ